MAEELEVQRAAVETLKQEFDQAEQLHYLQLSKLEEEKIWSEGKREELEEEQQLSQEEVKQLTSDLKTLRKDADATKQLHLQQLAKLQTEADETKALKTKLERKKRQSVMLQQQSNSLMQAKVTLITLTISLFPAFSSLESKIVEILQ